MRLRLNIKCSRAGESWYSHCLEIGGIFLKPRSEPGRVCRAASPACGRHVWGVSLCVCSSSCWLRPPGVLCGGGFWAQWRTRRGHGLVARGRGWGDRRLGDRAEFHTPHLQSEIHEHLAFRDKLLNNSCLKDEFIKTIKKILRTE